MAPIYTTSVGWSTSAGLDTTPTSTTIAPRVGSLVLVALKRVILPNIECFDE